MKKLYLLILLGCSIFFPAFSQTRIFQEVGAGISTSAQPIMENNVLVGYLAFTELEKVDKDTFSYRLTIMDENLKDLGVINFKEQKLRLSDVMIEDDVLCLAYIKSNVLGYTYEHRATRNKAFKTGKAWMFTQFINLKGEIIKTAQVPLDVNIPSNWKPGFIPASVLKNQISVKNISGKGFVCFYGDDRKKNMIFYDKSGQQTWEKKVMEEGEPEHFITSQHDVYLMMRKNERRSIYQYTIHSYNADDNSTYPKYMLRDKKGNNLLPLGFENDPATGKPYISGLIYSPKFRNGNSSNRDNGFLIRKGMYGGVFNIQLNGHKKGEVTEQFFYWYDQSKSYVTAKGHFESGDGYITPNKSFRDFNGNTYYTGSTIRSHVKGGTIAWTAAMWSLSGLRLALVVGNPIVGAAVVPFGMLFTRYREFPTGDAMVMKMDTLGKLKYEKSLPIKGSKTTGDYDYRLGNYCFTVVSPEDKLTYLVMSDESKYVIYSVEQKKVIRTIMRNEDGKSVMVLPAKEGAIVVATVNTKERYTMMSIESV